jgi:RNA polymerase sigma-70 factor (ECF subfamily)
VNRGATIRTMEPPLPEGAMQPAVESTIALLDRARSGDAGATERLLRRFLPVLRRWAHHRLPAGARSMAETDDLVQVTLMRALHRVPTFEHRREGAFLAYLRTILMNLVREEVRRSRGLMAREQQFGDARVEPMSELERLIGRERIEAYEQGLLALPEEQREAVLMRLEFSLSHQEIAEALGKPSANAARMTVSRALAVLARHLDAHAE